MAGNGIGASDDAGEAGMDQALTNLAMDAGPWLAWTGASPYVIGLSGRFSLLPKRRKAKREAFWKRFRPADPVAERIVL